MSVCLSRCLRNNRNAENANDHIITNWSVDAFANFPRLPFIQKLEGENKERKKKETSIYWINSIPRLSFNELRKLN